MLNELIEQYVKNHYNKETYRTLSKKIGVPLPTLFRFCKRKEVEARHLNKILIWCLK